jgi:CRISPR-associated protein Cas2
MYVLIVYDIGVERINKVRIFLRQYLNWVQNSVFEGELTKVELKKIEIELKRLIDPMIDSVRIYGMRSDKYLSVKEIGTSKVDLSQII